MKLLRTKELLGKLQERFPKEKPETLMAIIRQGMKQITWEQIGGGEVQLHSPKHDVEMTFYQYKRDPRVGRHLVHIKRNKTDGTTTTTDQ